MKKIVCIFLAVAILFSFAGCKKSKSLGFDISSGVTTFDPQLASSDPELVLAKNCFQGLMDRDENGALILGVAESYTVSSDGLIYTFYLKDDLLWSDGETPLTADDFVFAFQRLFSPETAAPSRSDFYNIFNAEEILSGKSLVETVGVVALDEKTVQFTLKNTDAFFPELLANAGAMPCNREFFESTKGRYGLGKEYILYNGAYYLRRINNYSYVLSPNIYSPAVNKKYDNVYLFVKDDPKAGAVERLLDETVDAAVINPADKSVLEAEGFDIKRSENTVWMLAFNTTGDYLSNNKLRQAIAYSVDKAAIAAKLSERFRIAEAFVPSSVTLHGRIFSKSVGENFSGFEQDPDIAADLFKEALDELGIKKLPTLTVLCTEEFIPALGYFQKSVQDSLAVFINLVPVTESELASAVAKKDYDIALVSLTPEYDSPNAIFSVFADKDNFTGFYDKNFNNALNSASNKSDFEEMAEEYSVVEQMLLQYAPALPLFYETSYFAVSKNVEGLDYSVFGGHISFRFCK